MADTQWHVTAEEASVFMDVRMSAVRLAAEALPTRDKAISEVALYPSSVLPYVGFKPRTFGSNSHFMKHRSIMYQAMTSRRRIETLADV